MKNAPPTRWCASNEASNLHQLGPSLFEDDLPTFMQLNLYVALFISIGKAILTRGLFHKKLAVKYRSMNIFRVNYVILAANYGLNQSIMYGSVFHGKFFIEQAPGHLRNLITFRLELYLVILSWNLFQISFIKQTNKATQTMTEIHLKPKQHNLSPLLRVTMLKIQNNENDRD